MTTWWLGQWSIISWCVLELNCVIPLVKRDKLQNPLWKVAGFSLCLLDIYICTLMNILYSVRQTIDMNYNRLKMYFTSIYIADFIWKGHFHSYDSSVVVKHPERNGKLCTWFHVNLVIQRDIWFSFWFVGIESRWFINTFSSSVCVYSSAAAWDSQSFKWTLVLNEACLHSPCWNKILARASSVNWFLEYATGTSCLFGQARKMGCHATAIWAKYACPLVVSINCG